VDNQCEFRLNRSTTDHVFCIGQILVLEKKWEYNQTVHQFFIHLKKAYDSVIGRSCIIFSLSLVSHETGKAIKNVYDCNV